MEPGDPPPPPPVAPRGEAFRFFVTCARGTEGPLRREIAGMRIAGARGDTGGVAFEGPMEMGMRVCLESRVAMRVLLELGSFAAPDATALYDGACAIDWRAWLDARRTFAVSAAVSETPALNHSGFAALKVKDAIVDVLREALGARPDVDPRAPDVSVRLHLHQGQAKLFLDLAGEPLHRRGYRVAMTDAPLKENLGAAILALGRVDPQLPFWDPMAGSGTLAIEQALAARGIAPGLSRRDRFGFEGWPAFAGGSWQRAWLRLREEASSRIRPRAPAPIVCSDRFRAAVEAARQNAEAAGVLGDLTFEIADVREIRPRGEVGNLVMNPPYGERLSADPAGARRRGNRARPRPRGGTGSRRLRLRRLRGRHHRGAARWPRAGPRPTLLPTSTRRRPPTPPKTIPRSSTASSWGSTAAWARPFSASRGGAW